MSLTALSFGGGVNSTAVIAGMVERGESPPEWILFADTGGEREETYDHVRLVSRWLSGRGWPIITTVRCKTHASLEQECLTNKTLPSLAFGNRGCSVKWKRQPQEAWLRDLPETMNVWARGEKVTKIIGIDAGEAHRAANITDDNRWHYRFPLIEWGWDRADCLAAIDRVGLPKAGKSACFFCPAAKKREVLALARERPDLFERAVAMERNANLTSIKGLGRRFSWGDLVAADASQMKLWADIDMPCMCLDGEEEQAEES